MTTTKLHRIKHFTCDVLESLMVNFNESLISLRNVQAMMRILSWSSLHWFKKTQLNRTVQTAYVWKNTSVEHMIYPSGVLTLTAAVLETANFLFEIWHLSKTLSCHVVWNRCCFILFNLVQVCSCYCKMFRSPIFSWRSSIIAQ